MDSDRAFVPPLAETAVHPGEPLGIRLRGDGETAAVPRPTTAPPGRSVVRRLLIGRARPTAHLEHTLLPKVLALPVFSSDAMSSVAYASEEALLVLVAASASARTLLMPISIVIAVLMAMVVASYRQTVRAYPTAAGSYVVSRENLGVGAGMVAAAALLTDYVLTVAVSVVAGVLAITSAAPSLAAYRVELSVAAVALIALANLRGVKESGLLVALPTYGFIVAVFALVATGLARCIGGCPQAVVPDPVVAGPPLGAVGLFVILHAFASGSTALTGVEAISNGVSAFRRPQWRNAAQTLTWMGVLAIAMFLGVTVLALRMGARPSTSVSVISEIARATFPGSAPGSAGPMYYVVQAFTFAILIFAANTSYQDFPRLAAILARDRLLPRQFENRGDRLVFSNGVIVLTAFAMLLILLFRASVDALIQLYVVGVFTAFTLSQAGMVRHWFRSAASATERLGWRRRALINGAGAVATGAVTVIVVITKFTHGAWVVIVAIPVIMAGFASVHRHYARVQRQLHAGAVAVAGPAGVRTVLYVPDLGPATARALRYVRSLGDPAFDAVHPIRPGDPTDLQDRWRRLSRSGDALRLLPNGARAGDVLLHHIRAVPRDERGFVNVVIPESFERASLVAALREPTFAVKLRLLAEPGVVVTDVPMLAANSVAEPVPIRRTEAIVLIGGVNDASVRAVNYARSLRADEVRAVFFAYEPSDVDGVWHAWLDRRIPVVLDIVDAPFRDLGPVLVDEVRRTTAQPGTIANVILPELVVARRRHELLHNQRALFIKRVLLFEPNVVLSSVPYRLVP